jgi:hypothetical protein
MKKFINRLKRKRFLGFYTRLHNTRFILTITEIHMILIRLTSRSKVIENTKDNAHMTYLTYIEIVQTPFFGSNNLKTHRKKILGKIFFEFAEK